MDSVPIKLVLDNLPVPELEHTLCSFLAPLTDLLPDQRLQRIVLLAVRGSLTSQTPVITAMAQSVARTATDPWLAAKRLDRFLANPRVPPRRLSKGRYHLAQATVDQERPNYLVVAVDPVNFEKPSTQALEGVSTVRKRTPPDLRGQARLTRGYPAISAMVVNTRIPATTDATWFSYRVDFRSEHWEIKRALRTTRGSFLHSSCALWVTPAWMTSRSSAGWPRSMVSVSSARAILNGSSRSTILAWIVGKPSTSRIWWTRCPLRRSGRSRSRLPAPPAWPPRRWVGADPAAPNAAAAVGAGSRSVRCD